MGHQYSAILQSARRAAGAHCAMVGSPLAGTDETPGESCLYQGLSYKTYAAWACFGCNGARFGRPLFSSQDSRIQRSCRGSWAVLFCFFFFFFFFVFFFFSLPLSRAALPFFMHSQTFLLSRFQGYVGAQRHRRFHTKAKFLLISKRGLREAMSTT